MSRYHTKRSSGLLLFNIAQFGAQFFIHNSGEPRWAVLSLNI
jgi:hypothetical protein